MAGVNGSEITLNAFGADLRHEAAHLQEVAAGGAEVWIWPDERLAMQEGGGIDAGMAAHQGDTPVEFRL